MAGDYSWLMNMPSNISSVIEQFIYSQQSSDELYGSELEGIVN